MGSLLFVSHYFLDQRQRARYHLLSEADLPALLATDPPAALLTGQEPRLEGALVEQARRAGYRPQPLYRDLVLWLR